MYDYTLIILIWSLALYAIKMKAIESSHSEWGYLAVVESKIESIKLDSCILNVIDPECFIFLFIILKWNKFI